MKNRDVIVTSALSLAEARRSEGQPPLPGEDHATLSAFFQHSYIEVVPVDRGIAEMAAQLGERFSLSPSDTVQLATAIRVKAPVFLTWDRHFHRANAMQGAPIPIEEPRWVGSKQLSVDESAGLAKDSE